MVFNFICYLAWSRCLFHGDLKMIEVLLLLKDDFCFLLWHTVLHQWPFECAVSIERNHDQYRPAEIENSNDDGNQRQFPEKFLSVVDCQFASTASHPQFFAASKALVRSMTVPQTRYCTKCPLCAWNQRQTGILDCAVPRSNFSLKLPPWWLLLLFHQKTRASFTQWNDAWISIFSKHLKNTKQSHFGERSELRL